MKTTMKLFYKCILLLSITSTIGFAGATSDSVKVHAAYSMLSTDKTGETILFARVIIDKNATKCPSLISSSSIIEMSFRDNTFKFDVNVCEAIIPFEEEFVLSNSDVTIMAAKKSSSHILVYGDTGCHENDCNSSAEPFGTLSDIGANLTKPVDVILHMGDYNYRGNSGQIELENKKFWTYDAGDGVPKDSSCELDSSYFSQNAIDSPKPDTWNNWWLDFFEPAKELLPKAPWVFARGNHGLCSRSGPGWFYFLGPGSNLDGAAVAQLSCPSQGSLLNPDSDVISHLKFVQPYTINLNDLQLIVMDTSNACDYYAPDATTNLYKKQIEQSFKTIKDDVGTWLITHRPIWGVNEYNSKDYILNKTLQTSLAQTSIGKLPNAIDLVYSGHMHKFQTLTFFHAKVASQIILGNSGVKLDYSGVQGEIPPFSINKKEVFGIEKSEFGFMDINYNSNGSWTSQLIKLDSSILANCDSSNPPAKSICILNK